VDAYGVTGRGSRVGVDGIRALPTATPLRKVPGACASFSHHSPSLHALTASSLTPLRGVSGDSLSAPRAGRGEWAERGMRSPRPPRIHFLFVGRTVGDATAKFSGTLVASSGR